MGLSKFNSACLLYTSNKVELNSGFGQGSRWGIKGVEDLGNGYSAGSVSYTHLDVYKRQLLNSPT